MHRTTASLFEENNMKGIRYLIVAAVLSGGMIGVAQAHVFVGVGIAPVMPIVPAVPVVPAPVYAAPPPVYYAPPPAPVVYAAPPVVAGYYYGNPYWWHRPHYYGYTYWR
jgi:hypothetical protein